MLTQKTKKRIYGCIIFVSMAVITAVCYHSLTEIHYLKTFYPERFTVEEAFYAASVELIKDIVIAIPFFVAIAVCLCLLKKSRRKE